MVFSMDHCYYYNKNYYYNYYYNYCYYYHPRHNYHHGTLFTSMLR